MTFEMTPHIMQQRQEWESDPTGKLKAYRKLAKACGIEIDVQAEVRKLYDPEDDDDMRTCESIIQIIEDDEPAWYEQNADFALWWSMRHEMAIQPWYWADKKTGDDGVGSLRDPHKIGPFNAYSLAWFFRHCPDYQATVIDENIAMWDPEVVHYAHGEKAVKNLMRRILESLKNPRHEALMPTEKQLDEVIAQIMTMTPLSERKQQSDPYLIGVRNGVVDEHKRLAGDKFGCLIEDKPEYRIVNISPWDYDPMATSFPLLDKFIWDITCGKPERIANLYEIPGACLWREPIFQVTPILYGHQGSDGKGAYGRLLTAFLGEDNVSGEMPDKLANDFKLLHLRGKLANISGEMTATVLSEDVLARWKMISGGDLIQLDAKHKNVDENLTLYTTLIVMCNTLPQLKSADANGGTLRRFSMIVEFERHFPTDDPNTDARLNKKLACDEGMSYFLNQALDHLEAMLRKGTPNPFTPNPDADRLKDEIVKISDSFAAWCDEMSVDASWFTCAVPYEAVQYCYGVSDAANQRNHHTGKPPYELAYHMYERWCVVKNVKGKLSEKSFADRARKKFKMRRKQVRDPRLGMLKHSAYYRIKDGGIDFDEEPKPWGGYADEGGECDD